MAINTLKAFMLFDFSDKDTCTTAIETDKKTLWFMNCYLTIDHEETLLKSITMKALIAANSKNRRNNKF